MRREADSRDLRIPGALGFLFAIGAFTAGLAAAIALGGLVLADQPLATSGRFSIGLVLTSLLGILEVVVVPSVAGVTALPLGLVAAGIATTIVATGGGDEIYRFGLPVGLGVWSLALVVLGLNGLRGQTLGRRHLMAGMATVLLLAVPALLG